MISSSSAVKWKLSSSSSYCLHLNRSFSSPYSNCTSLVKFPTRRFASLSTLVQSDNKNNNNIISSESDHYTSTVGSSPFPINHTINVTQRHIFILNILASAVAISTTWLFLSTIPTLLAFKRAAESLEKLMDVATEELPDTMAALRLSGMEISDLTMELTDLGQEITKGVRKSTRTVRMAEERLTSLTNMASSASVQAVTSLTTTEPQGPALARAARGMREVGNVLVILALKRHRLYSEASTTPGMPSETLSEASLVLPPAPHKC
ncbi:hypothetical protein ACFE04_017406 [Oxalis oulophora]